MLDKTNLYDANIIENENIKNILKEVYQSLEERGYKPLNQLVGYLTSGDPGYISSYNNARNKILSLDRNKILLALLEGYLNKWNV